MMKKTRLVLLLVVIAFIAAFFAFGLHRYLTLEYLKSQHASIETYTRNDPLLAAGVFFAIYVAITGLALPGAAWEAWR
jgi:uncharacterized membrane protein YdjX (TVP38/TMEM64 family)